MIVVGALYGSFEFLWLSNTNAVSKSPYSFDGIASNQAAFSKWPKNPDQVQNVRVFISKIPRLNLLFEFADKLFKRIVIFTYHAIASHASSTSTLSSISQRRFVTFGAIAEPSAASYGCLRTCSRSRIARQN